MAAPRPLTAAIVRTSLAALALAAVSLASQRPARAVIVPDAPVLRFDDIGDYAFGYRYRGKAEQRMPAGWSGFFEDSTGIACQPMGRQNGREAFLIHCPWRGGTGVTFQQFDVALPRSHRITLRGATAMRSDIVGKSDGGTFRVFVNGKRVLEVHRPDDRWLPFQVDLTRLAGTTAAIRFEIDPGPRDNPGWDYALWADRELRIEGFTPRVAHHPAPPALDLRRMVSRTGAGVEPACGFAARQSVRLGARGAVLAYRGADGEMDYTWQPPHGPGDPLFGLITLKARMRGDAPVGAPVARGSRAVWAGAPGVPVSARWSHSGGAVTLTRVFRAGDRDVTVRITGRLAGKCLVMDVACDAPCLAAIEIGGWGPLMRRRVVPAPYYSGQVHYLPRENLFTSAYLDWTRSDAWLQDGSRAQYSARTDGTRACVRERVVFAAAWHLAEVLPNIPNAPSPYLREMGRRMVLDVWGGRFRDIAGDFEKLARYGVRDCYSIIHVWQRSGYDNALPAHIPAAAGLGGDEGMRTLVDAGRRLGHRVALHENYVDYYPNYEGYTPRDVALEPDGKPVSAWYNPSTRVQAVGVKPTAIARLAASQSPEIHRRYGTNADYLDVHSAVPPWFHVDADPREPGAGRFAAVLAAHRDLWVYERATHGGPVTGEGNNHWYWSGMLDGAEAQFGSGWPTNQGMSAPLMVDFDLLKMHRLQVNHGMGYYERWWDRPQWGSIPPMVVLDQYRMQEVAFGHAAFLAGATWNVTPIAWLENHLMTPVTARYAVSVPSSIAYQVGGAWVDPTAAAKAATWSRVRVRYASGLTVTANGSRSPLQADGLTLPAFGWSARGAGVRAYTAMRGGALVDYAETAGSVFANARHQADWNITGILRVRPEVASVAQTAPRAFSITYRWRVGDRVPDDRICYVHFGPVPKTFDPYDWGIRFQDDHRFATPTAAWRPGSVVTDGPHAVTLPDDLPDGDYQICAGLCDAAGGSRSTLEGVDDGHGRIVLGALHVRSRGAAITFQREQGAAAAVRTAIYREHVNQAGPVVDFGDVRTDGSVLVRREGAGWVLRAMPCDRAFVVELRGARFGRPASVAPDGGRAAAPAAGTLAGWWKLRLRGGDVLRWSARAAR